MSVHDLLLALLLPSADDAAEDLAYNVGRRLGGAVREDDERAGAPARPDRAPTTRRRADSIPRATTRAPGTSPRLSTYLLARSSFFARVVATPSAVLRTGSHVRYVVNRNDLVGRYPVDQRREDRPHERGRIRPGRLRPPRRDDPAVGGARHRQRVRARDANTLALLDYGYRTFSLVRAVRAGEVLARPTVRYRSGVRRRASWPPPASTRVVARTGRRSGSASSGPPPAQPAPSAPAPRTASVTVFVDGRPVARIPLVLAHALPAVSPLTIAASTIAATVYAVAARAGAGAGGALAAYRWHRRERHRERATLPA